MGNQAFAAYALARQPMTASAEEEEIPANVTRVADNVIADPLDKVADELEKGAPPGKWPALRSRMATAIAGFDAVNLSLAGHAGQHWRFGKDNAYVAMGLMDALIAPDGFQNLRMAWGRTYGTLEQIAGRAEPDRAKEIREKALPEVLEGINLIPSIEKEEDPAKILEIRDGGLEVETIVGEACGDDPLGFAAMQQFRLGLEILRAAVLPDQERLNLVVGWLARAIFDVANLDKDPSEPYPAGAADEGNSLPPKTDPPPPAPSPNPLPPPPSPNPPAPSPNPLPPPPPPPPP